LRHFRCRRRTPAHHVRDDGERHATVRACGCTPCGAGRERTGNRAFASRRSHSRPLTLPLPLEAPFPARVLQSPDFNKLIGNPKNPSSFSSPRVGAYIGPIRRVRTGASIPPVWRLNEEVQDVVINHPRSGGTGALRGNEGGTLEDLRARAEIASSF